MHAYLTHFENLLQREITATELLLECLLAEFKALRDQDVHALEQTVQAKTAPLLSLEEIAVQRDGLLRHIKLPPGRAGMQRACRPPQAQHLAELWKKVLQIAQQCHDQNLINGQIIAANRARAQHALALLQGRDPHAADCYTPQGQASPSAQSQRVRISA